MNGDCLKRLIYKSAAIGNGNWQFI